LRSGLATLKKKADEGIEKKLEVGMRKGEIKD
jgi:hypothetical protein